MPHNAKTVTCRRCARQIPTQHLANHNKKCGGVNTSDGGKKGTNKGGLPPKNQRVRVQTGDSHTQKVGELQMEKHLATLSPAHVSKHTGMPSQFRGNTLKETDVDLKSFTTSKTGDLMFMTTPYFEVPYTALFTANGEVLNMDGLVQYDHKLNAEHDDILDGYIHMKQTKFLDGNLSRYRMVGESITIHVDSPSDSVSGQAQAIELDTVGDEDIQFQIDVDHLPECTGYKTWNSAEGAYIIKRPTRDYTQMMLPRRKLVKQNAVVKVSNFPGLEDFSIYGSERGDTDDTVTLTGMTGAFCVFRAIPAGSIVSIKLVRHIEVIPLPGSTLNKYTTPSIVELGDTDAFLKTAFGMIDRIQPASYNGFGTFLSTILRPIAGTVGKVASIFLGANNPVTQIANGVGGAIDGGMSIYNHFKRK
uniref:Capsid n=1 Tax=Barramundi picorna-like virus 1 TaxID=3096544 RepID=A0AB33V6N9_9PICO